MPNPHAPLPRIAGLDMGRVNIMGIVNVTPDSFADGGRHATTEAAIDHGLRLIDDGADILDIGGESTRPGSDAVAVDDELKRVIPVVEGLAQRTRVPLSVDTRKPEVMARAAMAGARLINDVSALTFAPAALQTAQRTGLPVVLMHAQGDPKTMQQKPVYVDVVADVIAFLKARMAACLEAGIPRDDLVIDPGIGFGKTLEHNLALLHALPRLKRELGVPVLLGASRKSFIGALTGATDARARLPGSLAAALWGAQSGVSFVRVHDVAETRQALSVWEGAAHYSVPKN
jgi:dihydropteroate synthase